jgi:probable addiction module antidote protein
MKTEHKSKGIPLDDIRTERFKDAKRASYAVKLALEAFEKDNDVDALLDTLRLAAKAQGGITSLSRRTALSRQALHEALSPKGNPRLRTFQTVLGSLGFQMSFKPLPRERRKPAAIACAGS